MGKTRLTLITLVSGLYITHANSQTTESNYVNANIAADRTLEFNVTDHGKSTPIIWGLDLAWLSEGNVRRGIAFMDNENVNIIRSSFTPTSPLINNTLPEVELGRLNERLKIIERLGRPTDLVLNCDHPSVDASFKGNPANWVELIRVTKQLHEAKGHKVVTVSPFNEPDYSQTGQGTIADFKAIAKLLKSDTDFDGVRISGGNTLNNDKAWEWYNYLKDYLDEGNTHQLAGSFDSYAAFFTKVRNDGSHASNDELHNVMEAMVGVEYGMQTGIWWGTAEYARGEFVKATKGTRLAYAEHRPNWTAASVYKTADGRIQAFGGVSERQAATTTYRYVSKDRDVYFDGVGPQREFVLEMPAGTGYQTEDQRNAERLINITYGDDIQPVINGEYYIVNRKSKKVLSIKSGSTSAGTSIVQSTPRDFNYMRWNVVPVDSRIGGDFTYFHINSAMNNMAIDVLNWSLDDNGEFITYGDSKGGNQQWFLEYIEDGYFYIRSRHSALCMQPLNKSSNTGVRVIQFTKSDDESQQWRFIPANSAIEFVAPATPTNLNISENLHSVKLNWNANTEDDLSGYNIYRCETENGEYTTIAQNVTSTSFVDNRIEPGVNYFYKIKAIDKSLNRSDYSSIVSGKANGGQEMFAMYKFDGNTKDNSENLINGAINGTETYTDSYNGSKAISLNGTNNFIQLPYNVANHDEMTVAMWIKWNGGSNWQRVFDFGNNEDQYMFLSPRSGNGDVRFVMKNNGAEQILKAPISTISRNVWTHITITISKDCVKLFKDGEKIAESNNFTISPSDIKPMFNYIGRSMFNADPMFKGEIDDFRLYNYALPDELVERLPNEVTNGINNQIKEENNVLNVWPVPAKEVININLYSVDKCGNYDAYIFDTNGRKVAQHSLIYNQDCIINVSDLNKGIYFLRINDRENSIVKRIIIE